jgi:hypothetical protein
VKSARDKCTAGAPVVVLAVCFILRGNVALAFGGMANLLNWYHPEQPETHNSESTYSTEQECGKISNDMICG